MSRRSATILVIALAAAALVTYGVSSRGDGSSVTLTVSIVRAEAIGQAIRDYRAVEPNVRIVVTTNPVDTYQTVLRTQLASRNAPDLFTVWPGNGNSMAVEQVAPLNTLDDLSSTAWAQRLPASVRGLMGTGGKIQMWTAGSNVIGAVYNRDAFRRVGATVPRTFGELLAVCERFKQAGLPAIAVGNQTPWVAQLIDYALAPSLAYASSPRLERFSGTGWRETLERYVELSRHGCFQPNPNGTSLERVEQLVAHGRAGMAVLVAPAVTSIRRANPSAEIGVFPFPAADRAEDLRIPAGLAAGLAVNARSPRVAAARRFLDFLARPENARRFNLEAANLPLDSDDPAPSYLSAFLPYLRAGRTVPFPDQLWPNADTQREHIAVAQELLAGSVTVDEALQRLDRAFALQ